MGAPGSLSAGSPLRVRWTSRNAGQGVKISLRKASQPLTSAMLTKNDGSASLRIPANAASGNDYTISIESASIAGCSGVSDTAFNVRGR
ncbi:MAG: hypothetical protein HC902_06075 [Calothrix sp. SM1_5_4]|nr:hypothetical protein [Calothrix sp. SM1_5_4]